MNAIDFDTTDETDKIYTFEVTSPENLETLQKVLAIWEKQSQAMQQQACSEQWEDTLSDFRASCVLLRFDILARLGFFRTVANYARYFFSTNWEGKCYSLASILSFPLELISNTTRYIAAVNHKGELLAVGSGDVEEETVDGHSLVTNPCHHKLCPNQEKKVSGAASAILIHAAKTHPEKEAEFNNVETTAESYFKALGCTEVEPGSFKILGSNLLRSMPPAYLLKAIQLPKERPIILETAVVISSL
jgi:hypothetical protein